MGSDLFMGQDSQDGRWSPQSVKSGNEIMRCPTRPHARRGTLQTLQAAPDLGGAGCSRKFLGGRTRYWPPSCTAAGTRAAWQLNVSLQLMSLQFAAGPHPGTPRLQWQFPPPGLAPRTFSLPPSTEGRRYCADEENPAIIPRIRTGERVTLRPALKALKACQPAWQRLGCSHTP